MLRNGSRYLPTERLPGEQKNERAFQKARAGMSDGSLVFKSRKASAFAEHG